MAWDRTEKKAKPKAKGKVRSEGASALKAAVREDEITRKKARKVARREPAVVIVPPLWNAAEHKPEYLEMLAAEKSKTRLKLSGQLLSAMEGGTTEKDGTSIPAPVLNLGAQLSGIVEQVATKAALAEFNNAKAIYERERQRLVEKETAQDMAKVREAREVAGIAAE